MTKLVWKRLRPRDLEAFLHHLDAMPPADRPLYGLVGKKKTPVLHWIFAAASKLYALYFTNDRIVLSQRNVGGSREKRRIEYAIGDLVGVRITRGVWHSIRLEFRDGFTIKLGTITRGQCDPVAHVPDEGISAFARDRLSVEQLTNCYFAYAFARLTPKDVLK
jgi:hypothetical protein